MGDKVMSWFTFISAYPVWVLIVDIFLIGSAILLLVIFSPSRSSLVKPPSITEAQGGVRYSIWKLFLRGHCAVVVGTYYDEKIQWWEATGLIGTSSALALGRILGVLNSLEAKESDVLPSANFPGDRLQDNLVLIGGPDANEVTRRIIEKLPMRLKFGDPDKHVVSITDSSNGKVYNPKHSPSGELTDDYGIALKAKNPFNENSYVIIVAGSFGHGTHAAARLLESESLISKIRLLSERDTFEVLLHTEIVNKWPQAPTAIQAYGL